MTTIRLETEIDATPGACFELSLSVDAHMASMGESGERAIAGVTTGAMGQGDTVTWRARHFGLTFRMTSVISDYAYPYRFVDEQRHGPFRSWWHEHTFAPDNAGTLMIDVVHFRAPFGLAGLAIERVGLHTYMTGLLRQRNDWLKRELETATPR